MAKHTKSFIIRPDFFPQIYVYADKREPGKLKVGYTTRKNPLDRIKEQYGATIPSKEVPYQLLWKTDAVKQDGSYFTDKAVHRYLKQHGIKNSNHEWFVCKLDQVKSAVLAIQRGINNEENRTQTFSMRPEQEEAVERTATYFKTTKQQSPHSIPRFLWNAKMRFGKTFTTYQLANRMNWSKILVLTFKPAVSDAWRTDLLTHLDFEGWNFYALKETNTKPNCTKIVCFGSLQDVLGKNQGEVKEKNRWIYTIHWDCVVFDEYHFGAWRENTSELFEGTANEVEKEIKLKTNHFLYLSGTPFRAIQSGEFIEEQIFNWTYSDEQRAKMNWNPSKGKNPYESLPQLMLLTYRLPDEIRQIALKGQYNEFDLTAFFKAEGEGEEAKFKNEREVQKWLDLLRGALQETTTDQLELGAERPPFPFNDVNLLEILTHTLWYLPNVASCYAMRNLMLRRHNQFYQNYNILVIAGTEVGVGEKALIPVKEAIKDGFKTKTITLTCGKLTTGVTIEPWTGIFMLRNLASPESYFQAAFRVQSPWVVPGEHDEKIIMKKQCFIFDFAPDRALNQLATYCDRLDQSEISQERKVQDFINFLPVLAYDGFAMEQVDAAGLLDMAMGRTTATLLAKGWNNALLINLSTELLTELMTNENAMNALMSIEGFRNAKEDIGVIISKSNAIQELKSKEDGDEKLTPKEKKRLTHEQKEFNKKRKEILDKLKIFATRIPLFMYLTDEREEALKQVITKIEPALFKKVTGITVQDFELLVSLGLFRENLMNIMVFNFRKYEDASMVYTGINRHAGEHVGLFSGSISAQEYQDGIE